MDPTSSREFARLYADHRAVVHAAAQRVLRDSADADEVTQDVFMSLWRNPQRFEAGRAPLRTYLSLLARSRALDRWRSRQAAARSVERLTRASDPADAVVDDCQTLLERDELRRAVRRAIRELPPAQREALALTYWGGLTTGDVARHTGVPPGTARSRLRLARATLSRRLPAPEDGAAA